MAEPARNVVIIFVTWIVSSGCMEQAIPQTMQKKSSNLLLAVPHPTHPPEGEIVSIELSDGYVVTRSTTHLESDAYRLADLPTYSKPSESPRGEPEKLAPALEERLKAGNEALNSEMVEVAVTFRKSLEIQPFPEPVDDEPSDSVRNVAVLGLARQMVADIERLRAPEYANIKKQLEMNLGATVTGTFWLINGMTMVIPLNQIRALARRSDVQYVQPNVGSPLPVDNYSIVARQILVSDAYFSYSSTKIGLLDSGVRHTHSLLASSPGLNILRDCVNGTSSFCTVGSGLITTDVHTTYGHGTLSASELVANGLYGADYRGITQNIVDSYRIAAWDGFDAITVPAAVVRGFEAAVANGDRVIIANIQDPEPATGMQSTAADGAFDANAMIIAAAGNQGAASSSIRAPGIAHKALAIGAVDSTTLNLQYYSGRGPTPADYRVKPDLLAPTAIFSAANIDNSSIRNYTGTSAAAPNAGGAAALMRSFLKSPGSFEFWPGYAYASMIAWGQNTTLPFNDNDNGAGLLKCPTNGNIYYGVATVNPGTIVDIPISLGSPMAYVDAALWWPESASQTHNDIDLYLYNPSGVQVKVSTGAGSVWEKARATTGLAAGTWYLRLYPYSVANPQTVYWAVFKKSS